ncbi:hypothetical protein BZB76_2419 [Actinomadura pelletieri DSM 43383]|uniref:Uncharacterized protein n=1 Tax=Actinomadura pelletieri DSM 43383 TaxID=1120940 RepID=A0A495QU67_9ACTN|nr:hypothetical protein [Actinomadura pelletieri]RKS77050.1 hypothetical protein BZB76_2419 [Actinomadura pelletieri DSM 43383]
MRSISSILFSTVDGVVESPDTWQFAWDEEMAASLSAALSAALEQRHDPRDLPARRLNSVRRLRHGCRPAPWWGGSRGRHRPA